MHDKAVDTCLSVFYFIPEWYKTQNMCDKAIFECPPKLKCYFGLYQIPKMCDKAADYDHDPSTIIYIRLFSWHYRCK